MIIPINDKCYLNVGTGSRYASIEAKDDKKQIIGFDKAYAKQVVDALNTWLEGKK